MNIENIKIVNISHHKEPNANLLAQNTVNTWQKDRAITEKVLDTQVGKLGEKAFEIYAQSYLPNVIYVSYDSFRIDGFKKHAPFDGLLFHKSKINSRDFFEIVTKINNEVVSSPYGKISDKLKDECFSKGFYITEIKTTRVTQRHLTNNQVDYTKILRDDFLEYPKYKRSGEIQDFNDYLRYCQNFGLNSIEDLLVEEEKNMRHIYIRAYQYQDLVFLIGCISNKKFIKNAVIKKMVRPNKSEYSIYLATPLKNGSDINVLNNLAA